MSFKGHIDAKCPSGCEPFDTEVWSYINAADEDLRLAVLFREANLLICPHCEKPFFPDTTLVYHEPDLQLMAFVMPESYKEKEAYWREKMHEDFKIFRKTLKDLPEGMEPEVFFGVAELSALLESEDFRREEREVMEAVAAELGLSVYRVDAAYARRHGVPATLPYKGKAATRETVLAGLETLIAENDRLTAFSDYLKQLKASKNGLPPTA